MGTKVNDIYNIRYTIIHQFNCLVYELIFILSRFAYTHIISATFLMASSVPTLSSSHRQHSCLSLVFNYFNISALSFLIINLHLLYYFQSGQSLILFFLLILLSLPTYFFTYLCVHFYLYLFVR